VCVDPALFAATLYEISLAFNDHCASHSLAFNSDHTLLPGHDSMAWRHPPLGLVLLLALCSVPVSTITYPAAKKEHERSMSYAATKAFLASRPNIAAPAGGASNCAGRPPPDVASALRCLRRTTPGLELAYPADAEAHFDEIQRAMARFQQKPGHLPTKVPSHPPRHLTSIPPRPLAGH